MNKIHLISLFAALMVACGPTVRSAFYQTGSVRAPVANQPTIMLQGAEIPSGLHELAIIQARCFNGYCDMPIVIAELSRRAEELGATHIVHVRIDQGESMLFAHGVAAYIVR